DGFRGGNGANDSITDVGTRGQGPAGGLAGPYSLNYCFTNCNCGTQLTSGEDGGSGGDGDAGVSGAAGDGLGFISDGGAWLARDGTSGGTGAPGVPGSGGGGAGSYRMTSSLILSGASGGGD